MPSVGTLFWVIIVAAVGGTIVVLLIAAVVLLVRQICRDRRPFSSRQRDAAKRRKDQGQKGGRHHGVKTLSTSMQLSACPSTETASSVYCWNDVEAPGGPGVSLLPPNSGTLHAVETEAWPPPPNHIGLATLQRYGTEV